MKSIVAIHDDPDVRKSIPGALKLISNMCNFIEDRRVAIKPNDTWASKIDRTACTSADSVEAVIRYIKKFCPRSITVTGGAGAAETADVFRLMGIDKVIRREKVRFVDHNRPPFEEVELLYGPQESIMVNRQVLEYECLISLAQHKVHDAATVTLTMKNVAMSFPAGDYYGHPRESGKSRNNFFNDLHGFIAGVCQRFPITIGVIVGHPAMTGTGPIGGKTFESGLAVASTDFVACDAVGAKLLGFDTVGHIERAGMLGLGQSSFENVEVKGVPLEEAQRLFRERSGAKRHAYAAAK